MRLALTTRYLSPSGGVEMQMLQVSRELARRGHQVDLLFNLDGVLRPEFQAFCRSMTEVPTFEFYKEHFVRNLIRVTPAVRAAVRARPDVLYVNNTVELAFGLVSGLIARAPVVCHAHGMAQTPEEMMAGMVPRMTARASRLICCSEYVRNQFLEGGIPPEKVAAVPNGIELADYPPATAEERAAARQELGLPQDAFVTLFFGRLEAEKGVEVLLKAWRILALPPEGARLLIVGSPAAHSDIESRLRELHALEPPGCHWLPVRRDVVTPLHAADVVAVPSMWNEAFGRVVVEGLASGLPVVASRVGGIPEILAGDLASLLFERGSAEELADRLASLMDWRRDRPELREQCIARASAFGIGQMIDDVESILREAVG